MTTMTNLIKKVKVRKEDGSYTDYIPIGVDIENVITKDGIPLDIAIASKNNYYNSVEEMQRDIKLQNGNIVRTLGYYEPNDGGGAFYIIKNTSTKNYEELENGLVAECILEGVYNIKNYGAKGNGIANDTAAIKKAIADANGNPVYFPSGTYLLYEQLSQNIDFNFVGDGETSIIKLMPADQTRPEEYNHRLVYNCYMIAQEKNINTGYNLFLKNIVLDANKDDYELDILHNGSSKYDHTTCIDLYQPGKVILDNVIIRNALIEGCYIYKPSDILIISNSKFLNNGYYQEDASGCHLEGLHSNTNVSNCIFNNNGFHGLLIAGNRIVVDNIHCENNGYTGLMIWGGGSYNNIANAYLSGNDCGLQIKSGYNPSVRESPWESDWMTPAEGNNIVNITTYNNNYGVVFGNSNYTKITNWESKSDRYSYGFSWNMDAPIRGNVVNYKTAPTEAEYYVGPNSDLVYDYINFSHSFVEDGDDTVPEYVKTEAENVLTKTRALQTSDCFTFLAMSDTHISTSEAESAIKAAQTMETMTHAGMAAEIIAKQICLDAFVVLGDITWGGSNTTLEMGTKALEYFNKCTNEVSRNIDNFRTNGNHDGLRSSGAINNDYYNCKELFPLICKYNKNCVYDLDNLAGGYCYKDYPQYKLRIIVMNTADDTDKDYSNNYGHTINRISGKQLKWVAEKALYLDENYKDWKVIFFSHHPLDWGEDAHAITAVLQAYLNGESYSAEHHDVVFQTNFSEHNHASIIACIHGHVHNYKVDDLYLVERNAELQRWEGTIQLPIKRIAMPNVCFYRNNEYGQDEDTDSNQIEYGTIETYNKTAKTAEDTAFCIVAVDLLNLKIYATHYGAGEDRVIDLYNNNPHRYIVNSIVPEVEIGSISTTDGSDKANDEYIRTVGYVELPVGITDFDISANQTLSSGITTVFFDANHNIITEFPGKASDGNYHAYHTGETMTIPEQAKYFRFRYHAADTSIRIVYSYREWQ